MESHVLDIEQLVMRESEGGHAAEPLEIQLRAGAELGEPLISQIQHF